MVTPVLLRWSRQCCSGGGDSPGGGGADGAGAEAALAELGPGSAAETKPDVRPVGQSTGKAGKQFKKAEEVGKVIS